MPMPMPASSWTLFRWAKKELPPKKLIINSADNFFKGNSQNFILAKKTYHWQILKIYSRRNQIVLQYWILPQRTKVLRHTNPGKQCIWDPENEPHHEKNLFMAYANNKRRRSACASAQSDQHLCCSLPIQYNISSFWICNSWLSLASVAEQASLSLT